MNKATQLALLVLGAVIVLLYASYGDQQALEAGIIH